VPGASVPCAGLTWVGARPDHRRHGLLTAMIATHFTRALGRGEPVSALFAAEPAIYGRFGYGSAASDLRLTLPRGAALRDVPGSAELTVRFETVDVQAHGSIVDTVHAAAGRGRPGWITRDTAQLSARHLVDPPALRAGAEPLRIVTVRSGDDVRGYALLRRKDTWCERGPEYTVDVREVATIDAAAAHRLWSFVLDLDLTATVSGPKLAVDDPLMHLLVDPRKVVPRLVDNLWIRVLDVPTALTGRRYSARVDVVLDVTDTRIPANAGRWRLTTHDVDEHGAWTATCERTQDPADITLDVRELGALYLGSGSLTALASAGLVTAVRPDRLAEASTALAWPVAPVCSWVF